MTQAPTSFLRFSLTSLGVLLLAGLCIPLSAEAAWGWKSRRKAAAAASTSSTIVNHRVLEYAKPANTSILIDVSTQRAYFLVGGRVAISTPVSTARRGKWTPRGAFRITEKVRRGKVSSIYHVGMPYWMRLNQSAYGLHVGDLPGYPASAGCIRMSSAGARLFFDNAPRGTTVRVVNSLSSTRYAKAM